uniref:Uncharacterized protein n=1 Tax=Aegilops tauschii subsp. strangulata TaxID=200361 RepID=A0A453PKR9_AEGTS
MKSTRNLSRGDGRRLGNASLIAFMLASLVLLSVIRTRLSPMDRGRHQSRGAARDDQGKRQDGGRPSRSRCSFNSGLNWYVATLASFL